MKHIKKIIPQKVWLLFNNKKKRKLNEYELLDLLIQLREDNEEGYSLQFNSILIKIDSTGHIRKHKGLFDLMDKQLDKLFEI